MNITKCCFIGVDEASNLDDVFNLQTQSTTELEFGILYSPKKSVQRHKRYPSVNFIENFGTQFPDQNIAIHLCGDSVLEFLLGYDSIMKMVEGYKRIQLNFSMQNYELEQIYNYLEVVIEETEVPIIVQHNKSKHDLVELLTKHTVDKHNLHILFDASGGIGRKLTNVKPIYEGYVCGYAGGINPDTVEGIIREIINVNKTDPFYIDMESGIRTNDDFSVDKCGQIISTLNRLHEELP